MTVLLFLIGKFDFFGDQALTVSMALEVDGLADLQKLAFYQISLAHHYVRATAIIEKPRIFITEPLLYDCLQNLPLIDIYVLCLGIRQCHSLDGQYTILRAASITTIVKRRYTMTQSPQLEIFSDYI